MGKQRLDSLCSINLESLGPTTPYDFVFDYIDISSVNKGHIDTTQIQRLVFTEAPSRARRRIRKDDVLLCTVRPGLKAHARIRREDATPLVASTGFAVLRANDPSDCGFLFHQIFSDDVASQLRSFEVGSSYPAVNESDVRHLMIYVPDRCERHRIAHILDAIDDAIDKTEAVIAKLKQIRSGLLHDLLTCGLDKNGQLRDPIANPEKFKDSPLGRIPREWEVLQIAQLIAGFESGVSVDSIDSPASKDDVGVLKTGCVARGIFEPLENKIVKTKEIFRVRCNPRADSIIISRMNTPDLVGESAYVEQDYAHIYPPDRLWQTIKRQDDPTCIRWLSYVLQEKKFRDCVSAGATGTSGSMKNISQSFYMGIAVRVPSRKEQKYIADNVLQFDKQVKSESANLVKLSCLKAGLSRDLLTGRVLALDD
jgi:type I restriction enzyme S subunit